jgi:hypothetical protein
MKSSSRAFHTRRFCKVRKKKIKGRCEKRVIAKCSEVCRTYDSIQHAYADVLQASDEVKEIRCNIPLDGRDIGEYTSDFVCVKTDNDLNVVRRGYIHVIIYTAAVFL